jgi:hypothetical protein
MQAGHEPMILILEVSRVGPAHDHRDNRVLPFVDSLADVFLIIVID